MSAFDQSFFQVVLEWGADGLARLAPADIVVVIDALRLGTRAVDVAAAAASGALVLAGGLRNAGAVARRIVAEQHRRGGRVRVAVIPAGDGADAAIARFAVEDQLAAGAIVAALGDLGIDHTSPEAAVACEAFRALRGAVRHLLLASGSGRELVAHGLRDDVLRAAEIDTDDVVPVLRGREFVPVTE